MHSTYGGGSHYSEAVMCVFVLCMGQEWGTCGLLGHEVRPSVACREKNVNYKCNYVTNNCKITIKTIQNYRLSPSWRIDIANVAFTPKNVPHSLYSLINMLRCTITETFGVIPVDLFVAIYYLSTLSTETQWNIPRVSLQYVSWVMNAMAVTTCY